MKHIKQPKRHIVLDDFEWRALIKGINEYRKQVTDEENQGYGGIEMLKRSPADSGSASG